MDYLGSAAALISVPISVIAAIISVRSYRDSQQSAVIGSAFTAFAEMNYLRIERFEAAHLVEVPETYSVVVTTLQNALGAQTAEQKNRSLLFERAVALRIFSMFEENLYQLKGAKQAGHRERARFLGEVNSYFTGRLLRNPRLLYLWSLEGGGLCRFFEESTHTAYENEVLVGSPPTDSQGPFEGRVPA